MNQQRDKEDKITELTTNLKQLSEDMQTKESDLMNANQKYQKEIQAKNREIEGMKQTLQQMMEHVSTGDKKTNPQDMKKMR